MFFEVVVGFELWAGPDEHFISFPIPVLEYQANARLMKE